MTCLEESVTLLPETTGRSLLASAIRSDLRLLRIKNRVPKSADATPSEVSGGAMRNRRIPIFELNDLGLVIAIASQPDTEPNVAWFREGLLWRRVGLVVINSRLAVGAEKLL